MIDVDTQRLRALMEAATPGPWEHNEQPDAQYRSHGNEPLAIKWVNIDGDDYGRAHDYGWSIAEISDSTKPVEDATLIVEMRNALPHLLTTLDAKDAALRAALEVLEGSDATHQDGPWGDIDELAGKLYAHHVFKYDPVAEKRVLIAALREAFERGACAGLNYAHNNSDRQWNAQQDEEFDAFLKECTAPIRPRAAGAKELIERELGEGK